ncbi:hypothetical protein [Jiangella rhizosphaerae]|uniref:Sigma-70 family RNA polymerase sigma factor n=1 Tax=Jiangella rhizosphaerae TaxID=2293569 RepID=A0A418KVX0_9ACTN|nr:hypothetical protein [Jiangella rhizosphaerae]RIQ33611.1 hypothetical protein DY240_04890 [Jiangella rhizosphaerae]
MPMPAASAYDVTCTGARRRADASLVGRLNAEWSRLCADPRTESAVAHWGRRHAELAGCVALEDVEPAVAAAGAEQADRILLALLRLAHGGDSLAGRTVLQLMLGKAVRIATTRAGRDTKPSLEHTAVAALWTVIATYPLERRQAKVAANIAMETLRAVTGELTHQLSETPTSPDVLAADLMPLTPSERTTADHELLDLLTWAVDEGTITAADATLILDIYTPAPGTEGGAAAAARHGLTWPAARQRASRAIRKVARQLRDDVPTAA